MKVNFERNDFVLIDILSIGQTFLADRKSEKGRGLYMIIDPKSGLIKSNKTGLFRYAVNLETGQIREFAFGTKVEPANVEVVFC